MSRVSISIFLSCAVVVAAATLLAFGQHGAGRARPHGAAHEAKAAIPLILQEADGDRLVHRAGPLRGVPFTIKVDDQFGSSEDFFVFTEALAAGQTIPFHKHENAEEILILEEGGATVTVGSKRDVAGPRSIIFIPRNTWISASNTGGKEIHLVSIFSRHGFEHYMRAISVKPGGPLTPLSPDELQRLRALGHAVYWDSSTGAYPPGVAHP